MVFGIQFVIALIVGILSSFASVPLSIIVAAKTLLSLKNFALPLVLLFSVMQNILMLAYCLSAIAIAMCYFSLSEQKEGLGILSRMDSFGKKTDNSTDLPAEQY